MHSHFRKENIGNEKFDLIRSILEARLSYHGQRIPFEEMGCKELGSVQLFRQVVFSGEIGEPKVFLMYYFDLASFVNNRLIQNENYLDGKPLGAPRTLNLGKGRLSQ